MHAPFEACPLQQTSNIFFPRFSVIYRVLQFCRGRVVHQRTFVSNVCRKLTFCLNFAWMVIVYEEKVLLEHSSIIMLMKCRKVASLGQKECALYFPVE